MLLYLWQTLGHLWQSIQVPFCFMSAWGLLVLMSWRLFTWVQAGVTLTKHLHRIPCADCHFFTGDYRLKCAVHPDIALSERAIDCSDFKIHPLASI